MNVRMTAIQKGIALIAEQPNLAEPIITVLERRLQDPDEKVRAALVASICEACSERLGALASLLPIAKSRMADKKPVVYKVAQIELTNLYRKHLALHTTGDLADEVRPAPCRARSLSREPPSPGRPSTNFARPPATRCRSSFPPRSRGCRRLWCSSTASPQRLATTRVAMRSSRSRAPRSGGHSRCLRARHSSGARGTLAAAPSCHCVSACRMHEPGCTIAPRRRLSACGMHEPGCTIAPRRRLSVCGMHEAARATDTPVPPARSCSTRRCSPLTRRSGCRRSA